MCGNVRLCHGELADRIGRLAAGLSKLGVQPGERVAILAANCHRYLEVYIGVPYAGAVIVPLNTRHAVPELRYALSDSGATVLITDRDSAPFADLVRHVIALPGGYESLLASVSAVPPASVTEDTLAGLFYTGGTTGASKGVMLTHRNLIANTFNLLASQPLDSEDRYAVIAPLFHAAGSVAVLGMVWKGGCQVVLPSFDPGAALDLLQREHVTSTLVVPTMLAAMAEEQLARPRDTSNLRQIAHGGSPIATEVVRRAQKAFPNAEFIHYYGATETAPLATGLFREERVLDGERGRSCGQALVGVAVETVKPDGTRCDLREVGEVVVRGANVMAGYWNKADATKQVLIDGWYHTGDLGYLDEEGYLFLVDRAKDMIVSGGENVYCTEVEEVLYRLPAVLEAAVFGVPDDRWGEAVHAVVVPRAPVTEAEIIDHCRRFLAGYKVPRSIELREEPLPKSGPGKVLKRELREPHWAGRDRRVN